MCSLPVNLRIQPVNRRKNPAQEGARYGDTRRSRIIATAPSKHGRLIQASLTGVVGHLKNTVPTRKKNKIIKNGFKAAPCGFSLSFERLWFCEEAAFTQRFEQSVRRQETAGFQLERSLSRGMLSLRLRVVVHSNEIPPHSLCCSVAVIEFVGKSWRTPTALVIAVFFAVGYFFLAPAAMYIREWRTLSLVISGTTVLLLVPPL